MSDNNNNISAGCGGGFAGLLTVLFIGLKLTGHIDWSWVWVLAPLWISGIFGILILLVAVVVVALVSAR